MIEPAGGTHGSCMISQRDGGSWDVFYRTDTKRMDAHEWDIPPGAHCLVRELPGEGHRVHIMWIVHAMRDPRELVVDQLAQHLRVRPQRVSVYDDSGQQVALYVGVARGTQQA